MQPCSTPLQEAYRDWEVLQIAILQIYSISIEDSQLTYHAENAW